MKPPSSLEIGRLGLRAVLLLLFLLGVAPARGAESLVAIGRVNSSGDLLASRSTAGGLVTSSRPGTGHYVIEIATDGAFEGLTPTHFVVHATPQWLTNNDDITYAEIVSVNPNTLTVEVRTVDVEDASNLNIGEARNLGFHFVIHQIPKTGLLDPASRYLLATGRVASNGDSYGGVAIDGIEVSSQRDAEGDYTVILAGKGKFLGDAAHEYVLVASPYNPGIRDQTVRCGVVSTASENQVVIGFQTDDVQDDSDDDNQLPENCSFAYSIYHLPKDGIVPTVHSRLNVASFTADGSAGSVLRWASIYPGAEVSFSHDGPGNYSIYLDAPGWFADNNESVDFLAHTNIRQGGVQDEVVVCRAVRVNADRIRIDVNIGDAEESGQDNAVGTNRDFDVIVQYAKPEPLSDLRIGKKKKASKMKGNNRYNRSGAGQKLLVKSPRSRAKYFVAVENDGNFRDTSVLRKRGKAKGMKFKVLQVTGGRKNVTAGVKTAGYRTLSVSPGEHALFQVKTRLRGGGTKGRLRLEASPTHGDTRDACVGKVQQQG